MSLYKPLRPGDPTHLGRYKLLGRLGEGGMGVVFLGQDDLSFVAIKTIKSTYAHDQRRMRQIRREVEAARRVPRYCTAQVYEYDSEHDPPFIVAEYIKGPTLHAEVTTDGPLSTSRLYGVAIGVVGALSEIHLAEVVHGDLTPSNVLLPPYGPRVIDFGIARVPEQTASSSGQIAGTPAYMAPEHFADGPVTAAADVFAWGSVMVFAGTGRSPFGQGSVPQIAFRIVHEPPALDGLDATVRPLIEAAMRKDPRDRPQAAWLVEELKRSARTMQTSRLTTMEVDKVLGSARQGADRRIPTAPVGALAQKPDRDGFPPRPLGITLAVIALVLALGVWFHPIGDLLGTPGSVANSAARRLFGYGAYLLPLVLGGWAVGLLQGPRTATLWPTGRAALEEAFWERNLRAWLHVLGDALRTMWRSPMTGGPVALLLGAVGLVHLARHAPPVAATYLEHSESGGLLGAILVRHWIAWHIGWLAVLIGVLSLFGGAARAVWPLRRRWGRWQAVAAAVLCLAAVTGPTLYLKGHHYQHWVKIDPASHQIAVVRGLDARRASLVERTRFTDGDIPSELLRQLQRGIPADDLHDARRLANAMPDAYDQAASTKGLVYGGTKLAAGTCLEHPSAAPPRCRASNPTAQRSTAWRRCPTTGFRIRSTRRR